MVANKGLIFKKVPQGFPVPGQDLVVESREFNPDTPPAGGVSVKNHYLSFDPYQRGRMRDASIKSYSPPFTLDQPITNRGISTVLKSDNPKFKDGDVIITMDSCETAEYGYLDKATTERAVKLDNPLKLDPKHFIGALGMPGLTAYSSFYAIGKPKKGETIFISAASGAVGQIVGQLAKHEGLKVIGSVGDDKKLDFILKDLGFDGGFNYKKEKPSDALKRLAPDGIDIYYENVGGEHLEAAIDALRTRGRIVACGMISQYNLHPTAENPNPAYPIRNLMQVVAKRLVIRGFIVSDEDMGPVYAKEHHENVMKWIHDGSFKAQVSVTKGIDNAAEGFVGMLQGKNFGKAVLEISPLEQ